MNSLFKNKNINPIDHNKKSTYVKYSNNNKSINEVLDSIFNGIGNPYNIKVLIKTKNMTREVYLVYRNDKIVLTLDNEEIPIEEIISIEKKT